MSGGDCRACPRAGAVGEITSWVYDAQGRVIEGLVNDQVNSAPLRANQTNPVYGIAAGEQKVAAIRGAMKGGLINHLISNEHTAELLLKA